MLLKKINPRSNSLRHKLLISKNNLLKDNKIVKNLLITLKKNCGRCKKYGFITVRHKGSGVKKRLRVINNSDQSQTINLGISYSPNMDSFVALKFDLLKKIFIYNTSLKNECVGSLTESNMPASYLKLGFRNTLKKIPVGSIISLIGQNSFGNSKYIKSAGNFGQIVKKTSNYSTIKLPSGALKNFNNKERASIGSISNEQHFLQVLGKAGVNRKLNKRPHVRGIAMNPVDHPHGGRTNGGKPSVSPWGILTKSKFKLKKRKSNRE